MGKCRDKTPCRNCNVVGAHGELHTVFSKGARRPVCLEEAGRTGEKGKVRMKKGRGQIMKGLETQTKFKGCFESNETPKGF